MDHGECRGRKTWQDRASRFAASAKAGVWRHAIAEGKDRLAEHQCETCIGGWWNMKRVVQLESTIVIANCSSCAQKWSRDQFGEARLSRRLGGLY